MDRRTEIGCLIGAVAMFIALLVTAIMLLRHAFTATTGIPQ